MRQGYGFTLIELVTVLVLVGILSLGAMGLFASKSGFSASLAKDQFVAAVLQAQQRALAHRTASSAPVTLRVVQSPDEWFLSVFQGTAPTDTRCSTDNAALFHDICLERAGAALSIAGVTMSDGATRDITFAQNGNTNEPGSIEVVFTGENRFTLCVTKTGFAFVGRCP